MSTDFDTNHAIGFAVTDCSHVAASTAHIKAQQIDDIVSTTEFRRCDHPTSGSREK